MRVRFVPQNRLTNSEDLMADTRTRLDQLEVTIEEADLAGIKIKLDKTGALSCAALNKFSSHFPCPHQFPPLF